MTLENKYPRLTMIEMSPARYQSLLDGIERLKNENAKLLQIYKRAKYLRTPDESMGDIRAGERLDKAIKDYEDIQV